MTVCRQELQKRPDVIDRGPGFESSSSDPNVPKVNTIPPGISNTHTAIVVDTTPFRMEREINILAGILPQALNISREEHTEIDLARRVHNSRAAIHRLPDEILREIFMEAGGRVVGYTCHLWREVTVNIPWLWRDIHLTFPSHENPPDVLEMASAWIQRCQLVPLDFTITFTADALPPELPLFRVTELLEILAPHWQRCRSLTATFWSHKTASLFFLAPIPMPVLQHLDFRLYGGGEQLMQSIPLAYYPRLSSLSVLVGHPSIRVSFGDFAAPYLTSVTIDTPTLHISELSPVIAASPALRSLTWTCCLEQVDEDPGGPMLILPPSTTELTLIGEAAAMAILYFKGQNVQSILIQKTFAGHDILPSFPEDAFPNLRKLDLGGHLAFRSLFPFVRHPCLEELKLEVRSFLALRINGGLRAPFIEVCRRNLQSLTAYNRDELLTTIGWKVARDIVKSCLSDGGGSSGTDRPLPKFFFDRHIKHDPWPQDILELCQEFPEEVFLALGPVTTAPVG